MAANCDEKTANCGKKANDCKHERQPYVPNV